MQIHFGNLKATVHIFLKAFKFSAESSNEVIVIDLFLYFHFKNKSHLFNID